MQRQYNTKGVRIKGISPVIEQHVKSHALKSGESKKPWKTFGGILNVHFQFVKTSFVNDLCKLGSAFEYYDVLKRVHVGHDVASGRALYYEGRICDSKPFLEKFRHCETDDEYLEEFNKEYDDLMLNVMEAIPDIRMRLQKNKKTGKIEMAADVQSVFDIAWYTFARLVADVAPSIDKDMDYFESQGSILTCMACGEYFVRHSSRQRYCNNPNCQAERNNRKARAYYERKKGQQ